MFVSVRAAAFCDACLSANVSVVLMMTTSDGSTARWQHTDKVIGIEHPLSRHRQGDTYRAGLVLHSRTSEDYFFENIRGFL